MRTQFDSASGANGKAEPEAEAVAAFLRAHPDFLAEHPELYRALTPPLRLHGEAFADHMAAMIRAERARGVALAERVDGVLAAGRAAAGLAARVQGAVLALMRAADALDCITAEFPGLLAVDAAMLCLEPAAGRAVPPQPPAARMIPPGTVAALIGGRDVLFRDQPDDRGVLHGEAAGLAAHDALVRVPGRGPAALLALAARDAAVLDQRQGAGPLAFLGKAVAAALGR
jgi:uncharacterized protein YigA (DUF484 family)